MNIHNNINLLNIILKMSINANIDLLNIIIQN